MAKRVETHGVSADGLEVHRNVFSLFYEKKPIGVEKALEILVEMERKRGIHLWVFNSAGGSATDIIVRTETPLNPRMRGPAEFSMAYRSERDPNLPPKESVKLTKLQAVERLVELAKAEYALRLVGNQRKWEKKLGFA